MASWTVEGRILRGFDTAGRLVFIDLDYGLITEAQTAPVATAFDGLERVDDTRFWKRAAAVEAATFQRMGALKRADEIRYQRAAIKRSIAALAPADGMRRVALLILAPPECVQSALVRTVLEWPRQQTSDMVDELLEQLDIAQRNQLLTLAGLTDRQRRLLAAELTGRRGAFV